MCLYLLLAERYIGEIMWWDSLLLMTKKKGTWTSLGAYVWILLSQLLLGHHTRMYVTREISALVGGLLYCHTAHGFRDLCLATFPLPSSALPTLHKPLTSPGPALLQRGWKASSHSFSSCSFEMMAMWFFIHRSFKMFVCAEERIQRFIFPFQGISILVRAE